MPELPEIETIKNHLVINIGASIKQIDIIREDMIKKQEYNSKEICNLKIFKIKRRGKYLQIDIEKNYHLLIHLGMSGRFFMLEEEDEIKMPHVHFILHLDNQKKLVLQDTRRFGGIFLVKEPKAFYEKMGVEPLSNNFTIKYLENALSGRKIAIKSLLLQQGVIAGIGNIYADEALFMAAIHPERVAGSLKKKETSDLHGAIRQVLKLSIEKRGTTFRDYRDANNEAGGFQNYLKVYQKTGEPCPKCQEIIMVKRLAGRSSHYCPHCQKI